MESRNPNSTQRITSRTVLVTISVLGLIAAIFYIYNFNIYNLTFQFHLISKIQFYVIGFLGLCGLYLLAVLIVFSMRPPSGSPLILTALIMALGLVFRLGLVPADPAVLSSDMYRYIWDGRVQQQGINPFLYPPSADELETLRDDTIYPNINRKEYPTLYPAGAQLFFRIFYTLVGNSVAGYKSILVVLDMLTLCILMALLRQRGLNPARIIVYAWNPLVIFEIAYSGHLDGLVVFLVCMALYWHSTNNRIPSVITLALAAAVKLYPALLLAAFLNRGNRIKGILLFGATIGVLYLPFAGAGGKVAGFLPIYLENPYESFNLGLKYLLMRLMPQLDFFMLSLVFILAMMIAGLIVFLKDKQKHDVIWYVYVLVGFLLILMPASLHPWYVVLMIPFLVFRPNVAWLLFGCTVTLSYLKYASPHGIMPTWVLLVEYVPLGLLLTTGFIISQTRSVSQSPLFTTIKETKR